MMAAGECQQVTAEACANIAICKYWGKRGPGNAPATPSISLTLASLTTTTTITRLDRGPDKFTLNGAPASGVVRERIVEYLELWREWELLKGHFHVESRNSFPTAAGLASSASGFAALATALNEFSASRLPPTELSRLARWGSGSAARSIVGGLAALGAGNDPAAKRLVPAADVPWGMVIVLVKEAGKEVSSREAMELSRLTSPFYQKWVLTDRYHYREISGALKDWDLERTGLLMEENTLAMHACMLTTRPPLLYWHPVTLMLWQEISRWRRDGLQAYATTDAGAHLAVLCHQRDLEQVARRVRRLADSGATIADVIASAPGGPARVISQR